MEAAIRVRALVLEEIRPSAGTLFVARRPSPVAVSVPVGDPSGAVAPLESLTDVIPLSDWRSPHPTLALRLTLRDGLSSEHVMYSLEQGQLPSDRCFLLSVASHMFISRGA